MGILDMTLTICLVIAIGVIVLVAGGFLMKIKYLYPLCFSLFLVSCSQLLPGYAPTSFCDRTGLSEPAANYSVTYVKKPNPQFDASYWNLCGPAWTRGGATLVYSLVEHDLAFQKMQQDLNGPKP